MFRVDPAKKVATYVKYDDLPEAEAESISEKLKNVKTLNIPETVDGYKINWGDISGYGLWQFCYCKDMTITILGSWTQKMIYDAHISTGLMINSEDSANKIIWNTTNAADVDLMRGTWFGQKKSVLYLPNISAKDAKIKSNEPKTYTLADVIAASISDGRFVTVATMKIVFKDATLDYSMCQ